MPPSRAEVTPAIERPATAAGPVAVVVVGVPAAVVALAEPVAMLTTPVASANETNSDEMRRMLSSVWIYGLWEQPVITIDLLSKGEY